MLASNKDSKQDARFAARIDVLTERVDTLASTVATTASAIAKKDGEIAALQRALEARDQTLQALVQHANRAAEATPADVPIDESELRSLRNAVAALTKERVGGVNAAQIERLVATVRALAERVDALAAAVAAPSEPVPDHALIARVDAVTAELAAVKTTLESPPEELLAMLAVLRERVDRLAEAGITEEQLDQRLTETRAALEPLPRRIDELVARMDSGSTSLADKERRLKALEIEVADSSARLESFAETGGVVKALERRLDELASGVESATTSHADEEQRLEVLHGQVSASSSRIESIADDLREALGALPEASPDQLGELGARLDLVEKRVASVAVEVARAKTLWPVALRSLEARLDDVAPKSGPDEAEAQMQTGDAQGEGPRAQDEPEETTDDLLAGLRDSLQAMETVAAELERTTETWTENTPAETPTATSQQALAGGARVVPLRTTDP